jgi:hypothetical protein
MIPEEKAMFIGHYAAAFTLKRSDKKLSLGLTFFAVFFVEIVWAVLVLVGIEKVNIVPGFTKYNDLQLVYYPYSHGLVATIFWGVLIYTVFRLLPSGFGSSRKRAAAVMAVAVVSHFVLDLVVHTPDLPLLTNNGVMLGLGLWNSVPATLIVEQAVFLGGLAVYYRATSGTGFLGKYGMAIFALALILFNLLYAFGVPPPSGTVVAVQVLVGMPLISAIAFWLDRKRSPKESTPAK